jgi:hypothetical protein
MFKSKWFSAKTALLVTIGAFFIMLFGLSPLARSSMGTGYNGDMGPPQWWLNSVRPPTPGELFITIVLGAAVLMFTYVFMFWSVDGLGRRT